MSLAPLVLLALLAGHPARADDDVDTPPRNRRHPAPEFTRQLPVLIDALNCRFTLRVDEEGRVSEVRTDDCYDFIVPAATAALMRWRFRPATHNGQPVPADFRVRMSFQLGNIRGPIWTEEQFRKVYEAHHPLPGEGPGCTGAWTLHPDGAVSDLATGPFPNCMIFPIGSAVPRAPEDGQARVCQARFVARKGVALHIEVDGCPEEDAATLRRLVEHYRFGLVEKSGVPWTLNVTFAAE